MPTFSGQLGSQAAQQGLFQLGARGTAPTTPPAMPSSARPYIAHLYNNNWSYRASLGPLLNRPVLVQALNSGYQPVTIQIATANATVQPGNLIVLTEQGGDATGTAPAGMALYGGIVEEVPDAISLGAESHGISITPFVAELGDSYLNTNYSTATDVAQMVRDAVAQTNHLRVTPYSCPNTGITATYNFSYAPCLEVIDHARLIAGINWSWFVDAIGVVWFQPINTTAQAVFTVKGGVDYSRREQNGGSITSLKNFALVVGGIASGATSPTQATYSNATSQTNYGKRALNPPVAIPGVTSQTTLNNIATTIGGIYDRVINRVEIDLPAYSQRILLGQPGGATLRFFEPSKNSLVESETGSGGYSPNYVVLAISTDGIQQTVTVGDVPPAALGDINYQVEANLGRLAKGPIIQPMVLQPQSGGVVNNALGTTLVDSTGIVSGASISVLVNGGTQSSGSITGKASPPTGLSGVGGEVALVTGSFNLTRAANVLLMAICVDWASVASGATGATNPVYFQVDGVTDAINVAYIPEFNIATDPAPYRPTSNTLVAVKQLAAGSHTVQVTWNSEDGTNETCSAISNPLYVFLLGS